MPMRFNTLLRAILAANSAAVPAVPSFYLVGSSPQFVTILNQGQGTITSTSGGNIKPRVSPSRTSGVAPLYVNFDATATTKTGESNPEHNLFFAHNFGDSGAGTWANGVQSSGLTSKNAGFGPVSGHVYETPGTYTYSLNVLDGVETKTIQGTITVTDPNVVYAGTLTICISHTGNFTGAPSGAQQVNTAGNTDMYAAWNTHKASNKRILFCKADSWVSSAEISANGLSNMIVGGYGTGAARSDKFGVTTDTLVNLTPNTGIAGRTLQGNGGTDIRFCEFRINCTAVNDGVGSTGATGTQITWSKIEVRGATESFAAYPSSGLNNLYKHDQSCFYECLSDNLYGYAFWDCPRVTGASGSNGGGATPCIFTSTAHPFNRFNKVRLVGTPPAGFSTGVDYYISGTNLAANTFSLSATRWPDTPINSTGAGTCDVTGQSQSGGASAFVAMSRGGIMGCYFDNGNKGEQTLRMPYIHTSHINNNYIARPNQTKNVIKLHPRSYPNTIGVSNGYTEKFILSGNVIDLRGGYSSGDVIPNNGQTATRVGDCFIITGYGNGGEGTDERMRNVIVESNITYSSLGNPRDYPSFIAVSCPNFTVRNNIADLSFGNDRAVPFASSFVNTHLNFAAIGTSPAEQTVGVRIYNNTMFSNISNAETAFFVRLSDANPSASPDQVFIQNNLWYTPNHGNANRTVLWRQNGAGTNITSTFNTDTIAAGGSVSPAPNFAVHPPVALSDWRPNTGSYAIDSGTTVPVLRDINNVSRYGSTYDLGAVLP